MLWRVIICYLDSLLNTDCLLFESCNLPLLKHTWGRRPAAMLAIYTGKGESQGKYISHMLPPSMNKAAHFKTHRKHKRKSNTEVLISGHQHLKYNHTRYFVALCVQHYSTYVLPWDKSFVANCAQPSKSIYLNFLKYLLSLEQSKHYEIVSHRVSSTLGER